MSKTALIFFFFPTARIHATISTVKILAAKTHFKDVLKIAVVTNFFLYAEPLVPEVCTTFCAVLYLDRCNIRLGWASRIACCILPRLCKGWTFLQGSGRLQYWQCSANFKKYLQCVLTARILTVDFVLCTFAVGKKNQCRFRHVGWDHSLVSWENVRIAISMTLSCVLKILTSQYR
jgi:hypothetical protein